MTCAGSSAGGVFLIIAGDLRPTYIADAKTCNGPVDFTDWTITFEMSGPVSISGLATGDASGVLTHFWVSPETDIPGDYEVIFHGVSPAPESKPQTFLVPGVVRVIQP